MSSRMRSRCATLLLIVLMVIPLLAATRVPSAAAASSDRRLVHPLLLGVGGSWVKGRTETLVYPGAMLEFDLSLGHHVALGLHADFTPIDGPRGGPLPHTRNDRLITGLDLKLLPLASGIVRPWVTAGLAASVLEDTGVGYGVGIGAAFVPDTPMAFFVDLRRYHILDMENPEYEQIMFRAGVLF